MRVTCFDQNPLDGVDKTCSPELFFGCALRTCLIVLKCILPGSAVLQFNTPQMYSSSFNPAVKVEFISNNPNILHRYIRELRVDAWAKRREGSLLVVGFFSLSLSLPLSVSLCASVSLYKCSLAPSLFLFLSLSLQPPSPSLLVHAFDLC